MQKLIFSSHKSRDQIPSLSLYSTLSTLLEGNLVVGKNTYGAGSPQKGRGDRVTSHGPDSGGTNQLWPPHSPAAAEEHLAQTAAMVSSLRHGIVQRGHALRADIPDSAATEELPNREKN